MSSVRLGAKLNQELMRTFSSIPNKLEQLLSNWPHSSELMI